MRVPTINVPPRMNALPTCDTSLEQCVAAVQLPLHALKSRARVEPSAQRVCALQRREHLEAMFPDARAVDVAVKRASRKHTTFMSNHAVAQLYSFGHLRLTVTLRHRSPLTG